MAGYTKRERKFIQKIKVLEEHIDAGDQALRLVEDKAIAFEAKAIAFEAKAVALERKFQGSERDRLAMGGAIAIYREESWRKSAFIREVRAILEALRSRHFGVTLFGRTFVFILSRKTVVDKVRAFRTGSWKDDGFSSSSSGAYLAKDDSNYVSDVSFDSGVCAKCEDGEMPEDHGCDDGAEDHDPETQPTADERGHTSPL